MDWKCPYESNEKGQASHVHTPITHPTALQDYLRTVSWHSDLWNFDPDKRSAHLVLAKDFLLTGTRHRAHRAAVAAPPTTSPSRHRSRDTIPPWTTEDAGLRPAQRQTKENASAARCRRRRLFGLEEGPGKAQSRMILCCRWCVSATGRHAGEGTV